MTLATIDIARAYRAKGIQTVMALMPGEADQWKRPRGKWRHFEQQWVTDAELERWRYVWDEKPNCGMICGQISGGAFVLDIDTYKDGAAQWWAALLAKHNDNRQIKTPTQRTGGGGTQIIFRAPGGWKPPTGKTLIGIDVRGEGGFAMLPPSLHSSGDHYRWIDGLALDQVEIAIAPVWLTEEIDRLLAVQPEIGQASGGVMPAQQVNGHVPMHNQTYNPAPQTGIARLDGVLEDGREAYMTRLVWAAVVGARREAPMIAQGDAKALRDQVWADYLRHTESRLAGPPDTLAARLEQEGRGQNLFRQKWTYALEQWDGKVATAASVPDPRPDRPKSNGAIPHEPARKFSDTPDADGVFQPIEDEPAKAAPPVALPRIHLRDIKSAMPPDRLIRKLLGAETLSMIYGPSGSGKSFLAMDMGLHIAMERDWFGRKVMKGAVLYVAAEGASGINNRIIGFKKKYMPDENTPFDLVPVAINLGPNGQDADKVIAAAHEMEAETGLRVLLIVVDTLARAMGNGDENTAKDMGEFVAHCDRIRQATKATILIVHHTGKNQSAGARGSSSLPAAVDTMIEVEVGDGGRIATIVKQKDGEDGIKFGFDLEVVEIGFDEDGEPITTCVAYTTDTIAKPSSKLSPQMRRAMEVLNSCFAMRLVTPPNRVNFPSVAVTLLEHWRNELRATGITDRNDDHKERASFSRIKQTLDQKGFIRMRDEYVWKCETAATVRNDSATKK